MLRSSGSYGSPESAKDSKASSPLWIAKWSVTKAGLAFDREHDCVGDFHQVRSRFQSRFPEAVPQGSSFFVKWGRKVKSTHSISVIPEFVLTREV